MATARLPHLVTKPAPEPPPVRRRRRPARWLLITGWVALAAVMAGIWFAGQNWPFRYRKMKPLLEDVFGSQIAIASYHRTYFPNPGFIATGLTLRRKSAPDQPPIGTVQTFFVQGRWIDLFLLRRRIQLVEITAFHLVLPPPGSKAAEEDFPPGSTTDFTGPDTPIARVEIHESTLDVLRENGKRFTFPIHQLHIEDMEKGRAMKYVVSMENAIPRGHIQASGSFGPLSAKDLGSTAVSGQFEFSRINLHDIGEKVHGTMRSSGKFAGPLNAIRATADTDTPDFTVDNGHPTPITGPIDCTVNGVNGDVVYHSIEARTGDTAVRVSGDSKGPNAKTTDLDLRITHGRAEDVLRPFLHKPVPISGPVAMHAHVHLLPSTQGRFLQRLQVDGAFDIPEQKVTDQKTEKSLSAFSERAQGQKAPDPDKDADQIPDAISSISGPAKIRDAVVTTHGLVFKVPGAQATLQGTFNFHTSAVHLNGDLVTKADIAHDATGFKSFLLKPLAPFFRKKKAGAVIPIAVTGTPGHYEVTQNITHTKG